MVFIFSKLLNLLDVSENFFDVIELNASSDKKSYKQPSYNSDKKSSNNTKSKNADTKQDTYLNIKPSCSPANETDISSVELRLIQQLKQKRKLLEEKEKEMSIKENALDALKQYVENKIDSLEKLQQEMQGTLVEYKSQENEKTARLVKIYESMKPKDAAKIFEQLSLGILLDVAEHMKETRLASILAEMKPEKAKELTAAIANKQIAY